MFVLDSNYLVWYESLLRKVDPSYGVTKSSIIGEIMNSIENIAEEASETVNEAKHNGEHVIDDATGTFDGFIAVIEFINRHRYKHKSI